MFSVLKHYLRSNLLEGLLTSPFRAPVRAWLLVPVYAITALALGFSSGLFQLEPLKIGWAPVLLVTLLISPSLLEEMLFRGLLIPRQVLRRGSLRAGLAIGWSTLVYVLWHPLAALTTSPESRPFFLDPTFLAIVTLLGITCGHSYVVARSLWVPILIHWVTVVVWVFFLGGHNLVLAEFG